MLSRRENLLIRPWQERRYIYHREKVLSAQPAIDTTTPPGRPHVFCKLKKIQREAERCTQIVSDNFTLLQHLSNIMRTTRVDHFWDEPPPNFLQRVGIYNAKRTAKARKETAVVTSTEGRPKTRKELCYACSPERYQKVELVPEERIPFPHPKKRITRKAESPPDWETQYKFRCAEDRPEFRGKVWRKPETKSTSLQSDQVKKVRRRRRRTRELLEESQSIYLSKRGLTLAVKFPSRTEVLMSNQRGTRVIQKELCECKSFPRKLSKFRKSQNHLVTLQSVEKFENIEVEDKIDTVMNEVNNLKLFEMENDEQGVKRELTKDLSDEETKGEEDGKFLDDVEEVDDIVQEIEIVEVEKCSTEEKDLEEDENEISYEDESADHPLKEESEDEVITAKEISDEAVSVDSEKNSEINAEGSKEETDDNESVSISSGYKLKAAEEMIVQDSEEHKNSEENDKQEETEITSGNGSREEQQSFEVFPDNGNSTEKDIQSRNESEQLEHSVEELQEEDEKVVENEMIFKPRITRQDSIIIHDVNKDVIVDDPTMDEIFIPEEDVLDEAVDLNKDSTEEIGKEESAVEFDQENIDDIEKFFEDVENVISEVDQDVWPEVLRENLQRESNKENSDKEIKEVVEVTEVEENSENEEKDQDILDVEEAKDQDIPDVEEEKDQDIPDVEEQKDQDIPDVEEQKDKDIPDVEVQKDQDIPDEEEAKDQEVPDVEEEKNQDIPDVEKAEAEEEEDDDDSVVTKS